ncbi:MAG: hypothetical protein RMK19_04635 [Bacteroidia bacterium]|nr:hypothetical protein [Bacteroidia bacterium]MDW8015278.1 hypothetical protein [Bacteroidia bacterium]
MDSTKRYYTLAEIAKLLDVPIHQARRWIRLFFDLPPHKTLRVPAEALPRLRKIREGVYLYRLRGENLRQFIEGQTRPELNTPKLLDYPTLLKEILAEIEELLHELGKD